MAKKPPKAKFIKSVSESKGRELYIHWYYYHLKKDGVDYYFNVLKRWKNDSKKEFWFELHAITEKLK